MKCSICKNGELKSGIVTVTLQRDNTTVILKGVPAEVCDTCGEYYLNEETTGIVMNKAEQAVQSGAEVQILTYAA